MFWIRIYKYKKTKYQTLNGEYVESVEPGTVRDCREFIKRYDGVENFKIYGNERYIYQYISEMYPEEEVKFDTTKIKISIWGVSNEEPKTRERVQTSTKDTVLFIHLGLLSVFVHFSSQYNYSNQHGVHNNTVLLDPSWHALFMDSTGRLVVLAKRSCFYH